MARQGGKCLYCGKSCIENTNHEDPAKATIDHIRPKSKGGKDSLDNLAIACRPCNKERGNRPWLDFAIEKSKDRLYTEAFYKGIWK